MCGKIYHQSGKQKKIDKIEKEENMIGKRENWIDKQKIIYI